MIFSTARSQTQFSVSEPQLPPSCHFLLSPPPTGASPVIPRIARCSLNVALLGLSPSVLPLRSVCPQPSTSEDPSSHAGSPHQELP